MEWSWYGLLNGAPDQDHRKSNGTRFDGFHQEELSSNHPSPIERRVITHVSLLEPEGSRKFVQLFLGPFLEIVKLIRFVAA